MIEAALQSLGYWPFYEPLPVHDIWLWLMLPLVAAIAIVYKTLKIEDLRDLPGQALSLAVQIVAFMIVAAVLLWVLTEWL